MTKRIRVRGRWDCNACSTEMIAGEHKFCPNCGDARDDEKVYFPSIEPVTEGPLLRDIGPDWICDSCSTAMANDVKYCTNCGAIRGKSKVRPTKVYAQGEHPTVGGEEVELDESPIEVKEDWEEDAPQSTSVGKQPNKSENDRILLDATPITFDWSVFKPFAIGGGAVIAVILLVFGIWSAFFKTHEVQSTLTGYEWTRVISLEEYRTVREEGWSLPSNARLVDKQWRFSHTERVKVGEHPETVTRTRSETYSCGGHFEDTGDGGGYYVEDECSRDVSYTENITVDDYENRDVYADYYIYDIDKWVHVRDVTTGAKDHSAPYWGEFTLLCEGRAEIGCQRVGSRDETYLVFFKDAEGETYSYREDKQSDWEKYELGATYTLRVNAFGVRNDPLHPDKE